MVSQTYVPAGTELKDAFYQGLPEVKVPLLDPDFEWLVWMFLR
jgi:hypothetical protein